MRFAHVEGTGFVLNELAFTFYFFYTKAPKTGQQTNSITEKCEEAVYLRNKSATSPY